jgi:hypothetical protein
MKKVFFLFSITLFVTLNLFSQTADLNLGTKHNQLVDYLNSYDFSGKDENAFMDDLIYNTGKMFDANTFPEGKGGLWGVIQFCGQADPGPLNTKAYEDGLTLLEQRGQISSASNIFLNNIVSQTENISDYTSFVAKVAELENGYNTNVLAENEKVIVTGLVSIFKSSAEYWNNYFDASEVTPDDQGRFRFRCFWCVAKKDIFGAAIGFLIGNCLCKKLGVVNPAICGAVGAVSFGGLYSWAAKVCPDVCNRCRKPSPNSYPSWICILPFLYL